MEEDNGELAAALVGCDKDDLRKVRWDEQGLVVIWGIGWKRVFSIATVAGARSTVRARMIVDEPVVVALPLDDVAGLRATFSERVANVLIRAGYASLGAVRAATDEQLRAVGGIGPRTLADIRRLVMGVGDGSDAGAV